ncbi:hypothetical protein Zmor_003149 [Zophobas morio]|uniref:Uncharacterized protein n=1 Tax=Zophobas morio TaxID=2755281 RepID=A0AA38HL54_9CUCU|nr:hypothetical protein Zmor_003149 [Zophobas morio]
MQMINATILTFLCKHQIGYGNCTKSDRQQYGVWLFDEITNDCVNWTIKRTVRYKTSTNGIEGRQSREDTKAIRHNRSLARSRNYITSQGRIPHTCGIHDECNYRTPSR